MPTGAWNTRLRQHLRCRHIDAGIATATMRSASLASGHPGVFAGVAGRVTAPLRMYESESATQNRRSQELRLSCDDL
jgi:hypothetical protein